MEIVIPNSVIEQLRHAFNAGSKVVVLTGAGISAESGIPTFRGKDGFWVVGSNEYQPQTMATFSMFQKHPEYVWAWYLYRLGICSEAEPNAGHYALVDLERELGERFQLVTQNVDGLHIRAGSSAERMYQIHGNIRYVRCVRECGHATWPLPDAQIKTRTRESGLTKSEKDLLRCPACGEWARPHVLWFDECYDEENYHWESTMRAAQSASVLLVVGTSGATTLPMQMGQCAAQAGALIIDVNIEENPFSQLAESVGGAYIQGPSASVLPKLVKILKG